MNAAIWKTIEGEGPIVASAIHDGHDVRPEVAILLALDDAQRLREEDPHTAGWTRVAPTRIVGLVSRFEVDLNRPRESAIYLKPEDAWGLRVYESPPPAEVVAATLRNYDAFYAGMKRLFEEKSKRHGKFVVLDLHTYNHRRDGPDAEPADPRGNPEVNIGTGTINDRTRWAPLIDRFMNELRGFDYGGRRLDVRENVKFKGGNFARWVHEAFPTAACVLSVEFKKFFMDEWTGIPDPDQVALIQSALESTTAGMEESLSAISNA
jgi:hypothetical protein